MFTEADYRYMALALQLAERGRTTTDPNPSVGCVIVADGEIVGEGHTQPPGSAHAEVVALEAAKEHARGATVYVTLEPCAHVGRTGPCAQALIEARVSRVVAALTDPNEQVAGQGFAKLEAAGIAVERGLLEAQARLGLRGYMSRVERGRPWVRLKLAASLDGRTALANGQSQWLTGPLARQDVHRQRAAASAIMTGIGTVLADDPALTVRLDDATAFTPPARVVVDSDLKIGPEARLLEPPGGVLIFTGNNDESRVADLVAKGARVERVPTAPRCALDRVLARLAELEFNTVWVEAGPTLAGSLLEARLVDELIVYFAPDLLGHTARGMFDLPEFATLNQRIRFEFSDVRSFGRDLRITLTPCEILPE